MTISSATYARTVLPRAAVTLDSETGTYTCVIDEISDLAPARTVSADEAAAGVDSLDPPTCHAQDARSLVEAAQRAVEGAVEATVGPGTPPEIVLARYKTASAVKGALLQLGIDV